MLAWCSTVMCKRHNQPSVEVMDMLSGILCFHNMIPLLLVVSLSISFSKKTREEKMKNQIEKLSRTISKVNECTLLCNGLLLHGWEHWRRRIKAEEKFVLGALKKNNIKAVMGGISSLFHLLGVSNIHRQWTSFEKQRKQNQERKREEKVKGKGW